MAERNDASLLFVVEWFDPLPQMKKKYLLKYFVDQNMAEMVDLKSRKMFLKKSSCPDTFSKEDFYIGSKIQFYSRELEIVDYGDGKTRDKLHHQTQQVFVLISCGLYQQWGQIVADLNDCMTIIKVKSVLPSASEADKICGALDLDGRTSKELSSGVVLTLVLNGENGFEKVESVGAGYKSSGAFFYSDNGQQTSALGDLLAYSRTTATLDSCTCCIVKPHAFKSKQLGPIMQQIIRQGYEISAVRSHQFERVQAEEFLEVYKGVVPEYPDLVAGLCIGISVALEIRAENAVETFRETAGPWDVEMARVSYKIKDITHML